MTNQLLDADKYINRKLKLVSSDMTEEAIADTDFFKEIIGPRVITGEPGGGKTFFCNG